MGKKFGGMITAVMAIVAEIECDDDDRSLVLVAMVAAVTDSESKKVIGVGMAAAMIVVSLLHSWNRAS